MNKKLVYLDHAATTPVLSEVVLAMEPYWSAVAANPSSLHRCGQNAIAALDAAREGLQKFVGAKAPREIIFTGSATEANNLAIRGIVKSRAFDKPHIVTTAIEHASVLETVRALGIWPNPMRYQPLNSLRRNEYIGPHWTDAELKRFMRYWSNLRVTNRIPFAEFAHRGQEPDRVAIEQMELTWR